LYGSTLTGGSGPVKKKKRRVKIGGAMQPEPLIREGGRTAWTCGWENEKLVYENIGDESCKAR
jgi:hypothetical protein